MAGTACLPIVQPQRFKVHSMFECHLLAQSSPLRHGSKHARKCSTDTGFLLTACVLDETCQTGPLGELLSAAQVLASCKIFTTPPSRQGHRGQYSPLYANIIVLLLTRGGYIINHILNSACSSYRDIVDVALLDYSV